jgi:hypothetical protein
MAPGATEWSLRAFLLCKCIEVKWLSTTNGEGYTTRNMIVTAEVGTRPLADLIKQVQAGDEVLLT